MHKIFLNQNEITPSNVNAPYARQCKPEYLWASICKWHSVVARNMTKYAIQRKKKKTKIAQYTFCSWDLGRILRHLGALYSLGKQEMPFVEGEGCYGSGSTWLFFHLWNGEFRIKVSVPLFLKVYSVDSN